MLYVQTIHRCFMRPRARLELAPTQRQKTCSYRAQSAHVVWAYISPPNHGNPASIIISVQEKL